jgi:hypothetical protein
MSSKDTPIPATENENAVVESTDYPTDWWVPRGFDQAARMAGLMAKSDCVPDVYRGKPGDILAAWSLGAPLGLSLLATLRFITVINGVPSIWGDAALAITKAHPHCEYVHEDFEGEPFNDEFEAICTIKRRGDPKPVTRRFSVGDAKTAKLWMRKTKSGGDTTWVNYPKRMRQMRARSWAMRDSFPDALCGLPLAEEMRDITSDVRVVDTPEDTRTESQKLLAHSRQRTELSAETMDAKTVMVDPAPSNPDAQERNIERHPGATSESPEEPQEAASLMDSIKDTIGSAKTAAHLEAIVARVKDLYEEGKIHSSEEATITQMVIDQQATFPKKGKGKKK